MIAEKVVIVGAGTRQTSRAQTQMHLDELERLVETAGGRVVARDLRSVSKIDPATFVGSGAVEEIARVCHALEAGVVIFDDDLSPGQARNLEESLPRVTDRAGLILEIFSLHARSREARTQVELAQLEYLLPRLAGKYRGLSRQMGGFGGRGGGGEQQLELDRRKIRHRISLLKKDLAKIETSRRVQRRGRRDLFQIAIAGYTNAGKTTLFNRLTSGSEFAADRLFATLDARIGKLKGSDGVVVIDTVGLIRKLPAGLVASFRSTLSEIRDADLVLHAIDGSSEFAQEEKQIAEETFAELKVDPARVVPVYTKADLFAGGNNGGLEVSSFTGVGFDRLEEEIARRRAPDSREISVRIPYARARDIARARARARVLSETDEGDALVLRLCGPPRNLSAFEGFEIR